MNAIMTLNLVNKESNRLFTRKIGDKRLFINAILVRINGLVHDALLGKTGALIESYKVNFGICNMTDFFYDEIDKYEGLLERRNGIDYSKVSFTSKFKHEISCDCEININFMGLIESFDKLTSIINLVYLSGGFDSRGSFYSVEKKIQKKLNSLLSQIVTTKATKDSQENVTDILKTEHHQSLEIVEVGNIDILIKAMNSSYAPGLSKQNISQVNVRLKQLKKEMNDDLRIKEASVKLKELNKDTTNDLVIKEAC